MMMGRFGIVIVFGLYGTGMPWLTAAIADVRGLFYLVTVFPFKTAADAVAAMAGTAQSVTDNQLVAGIGFPAFVFVDTEVVWLCRTSCHSFGFLTHFFVLVSIPFFSFLERWQNLSCSDNILIINLAKLSDWGMPLYPHQFGYNSIVCCVKEHIDQFQPHNYFPAQSLHFRFGSISPCPTLKPNVTASVPRTRYRRLVRPYLIGFSTVSLSTYQSLQNFSCSLVEISYADFAARTQ